MDYGLAKKTRRTYGLQYSRPAPECILSKGHDAAVDYWALGIILFEMTAGFTPFVGCDQMEI